MPIACGLHRTWLPAAVLALTSTAIPAAAARQLLQQIVLKARNSTGDLVFAEADTGREHVFHGTNVVVKGPPWLPSQDGFDPLTSLVAEDFVYLRQVGMNLLRLGVTWAAGEPTRGNYDEDYFGRLRDLVELAAAEDMYVLLDMHQDTLSEKFCGQGLPAWAVIDPTESYLHFPVPLQVSPAPVQEDGFPSRQKCENIYGNNFFGRDKWDISQGAYATQHAYEGLYTNVDGITDAWGSFLAKVASTVKGMSNVLGIELLNEPFAGNAIKHPELLIPGLADKMKLQQAYDTVAKSIRKVDEDVLLFFEGVTWNNLHKVGFDHAPGGAEFANRSVLAYHYYRPPQPDGNFSTYMEVRRTDARRLGTGLFMTESCCGNLYDHAMAGLAAEGQSWAHWEWKDWCRENDTSMNWTSQDAAWGACKTGYGAGPFSVHPGDAKPSLSVMKQLAQPYAQSISGELNGTSWNAKTGVFELSYVTDPRIRYPTVVFLNKNLLFPYGYKIIVTPSEALNISEVGTHQILLTPYASFSQGCAVVVQIRRKSRPFWKKYWPFWTETRSANYSNIQKHRRGRHFLVPHSVR